MNDRFVLIGHPVAHSVSPAIHRAAYDCLGRAGSYELADCPDEASVKRCVAQLASGELRGANVTVPWKKLAYQLADVVAPSAEHVGVANVLSRDTQGRVVAHNTDATALADELLEATAGDDALQPGRPCALVIGNGGAARAAVVACRLAGFEQIGVTARAFEAATSRENWPHWQDFCALGATPLPWPTGDGVPLTAYLARSRLLVQATSAGMKGIPGGEQLVELLPWRSFSQGAAYDLVYNPPVTPFLRRARASGLRAVGGLGMLVGQAAHAIDLWWGVRPERAPLMVAAQEALVR